MVAGCAWSSISPDRELSTSCPGTRTLANTSGRCALSRLLPYADALVTGYLRDALESGVTVEAQLSVPIPRVPYVFVQVVSGDEVDPQFLGVPVLEVECYARGSKRAAADLAEDVRVALFTACVEV